MIRLLTTSYQEPDPVRRAEYDMALRHNVECPAIDEIVIFNEGAELAINHQKIRTVPIMERPVYQQFFDHINQFAEVRDISIMANTDIYFDTGIGALNYMALNDTCLALSRWDVSRNGARLFDRNDSQDCWVFQGRIKQVKADFYLGVPRCDNRLAYELERAGYKVLNPSFSLRAYHLHVGPRSEYTAVNLDHFVPPPYKYVWPHNFYGLLPTIVHNLRYSKARLGYRLDRRALQRLFPCRAARRLARILHESPVP